MQNGHLFKGRSGWRKETPAWGDVSGKLHPMIKLIWALREEQGTESRKQADENILGEGRGA